MKKEKDYLGSEKITKLLLSFALPSMIGMLVNSLYNIVDQISIGWGVGYLGNAATSIIFPLNMVCLAFALMLGDGASAYLSIKL
jgi:Na+-driven multidrug efflux pump